MSKNPASQFYWSDWLREVGLRKATFAARGYWIDMLARMHFATPRGILTGTRTEIARLMGCSVAESNRLLNVLSQGGVCDFNFGENGILTVICRRMVRESEISTLRSEVGSKGGSKTQANLKQTFKQNGGSPSPISYLLSPTPKKEKTSSSCPKPAPDEAVKLAHLLADLILAHNPKSVQLADGKRERTVLAWASDLGKLHRLDKQTWKDIEQVIRWCQTDDFWAKNILSGATLRRQWDKLVVKVKVVSTGRAGPTAEETRELIDDIEGEERRWELLSPEEQEAEAAEAKRIFEEFDTRYPAAKKPALTGGLIGAP